MNPRKRLRSAVVTQLLLESDSIQAFLAGYSSQLRSQGEGKLSYAMLARKLGLESRSSMRDLVIGRRKFSKKWARALATALGLASDQRQVFLAIALDTEGSLIARTKGKLAQSRNRLNTTSQSSIFEDLEMPAVYSGLGSLTNGSKLEEIRARTGYGAEQVKRALKKLEVLGLVRVEGERYFPLHSHIDFREQDTSSFLDYYRKVSLNLVQSSKKKPRSRMALYQASAFSVSARALPASLDRLNDLIANWIASVEEEEGEEVFHLSLGVANVQGA